MSALETESQFSSINPLGRLTIDEPMADRTAARTKDAEFLMEVEATPVLD